MRGRRRAGGAPAVGTSQASAHQRAAVVGHLEQRLPRLDERARLRADAGHHAADRQRERPRVGDLAPAATPAATRSPRAGQRAPSGSVRRPATGARSTAARSVSGTTSPGMRLSAPPEVERDHGELDPHPAALARRERDHDRLAVRAHPARRHHRRLAARPPAPPLADGRDRAPRAPSPGRPPPGPPRHAAGSSRRSFGQLIHPGIRPGLRSAVDPVAHGPPQRLRRPRRASERGPAKPLRAYHGQARERGLEAGGLAALVGGPRHAPAPAPSRRAASRQPPARAPLRGTGPRPRSTSASSSSCRSATRAAAADLAASAWAMGARFRNPRRLGNASASVQRCTPWSQMNPGPRSRSGYWRATSRRRSASAAAYSASARPISGRRVSARASRESVASRSSGAHSSALSPTTSTESSARPGSARTPASSTRARRARPPRPWLPQSGPPAPRCSVRASSALESDAS